MSLYLSIACRISARSCLNSRSRVARTLARESGTAMVARINMMLKATISSTRVRPRWFFRFNAIPLIHRKSEAGRSRGHCLPLRIPYAQVGDGDRGSALSHTLENQSDQHARAAASGAARLPVQVDNRRSVIVLDVLVEDWRLSARGQEVATPYVIQPHNFGVVLYLERHRSHIIGIGDCQRHCDGALHV